MFVSYDPVAHRERSLRRKKPRTDKRSARLSESRQCPDSDSAKHTHVKHNITDNTHPRSLAVSV